MEHAKVDYIHVSLHVLLVCSKYAKGPPLRIRLYYMHPEDYTWVGSVDVKTTWGEKDPDHGFRSGAHAQRRTQAQLPMYT